MWHEGTLCKNVYLFKDKTAVTLCNAAQVRAGRNTQDSWHVASKVMFGHCTSRSLLLFSIFRACPLCRLGHGLQFKRLSQRLSHDESAPRHRQGYRKVHDGILERSGGQTEEWDGGDSHILLLGKQKIA